MINSNLTMLSRAYCFTVSHMYVMSTICKFGLGNGFIREDVSFLQFCYQILRYIWRRRFQSLTCILLYNFLEAYFCEPVSKYLLVIASGVFLLDNLTLATADIRPDLESQPV